MRFSSLKIQLEKKINSKNTLHILTNILIWLVLTVVTYLFMEIMHYGTGRIGQLISTGGSLAIVNNIVIFLLLTSFCLLFNRVLFSIAAILIIPVAATYVSKILNEIRGAPLVWSDIFLINEALEVYHNYISNAQIIIFAICGLVALFTCILFYIHKPFRTKLKFKTRFIVWLISFLILIYQFLTVVSFSLPIIKPPVADNYYSGGIVHSFVENYLSDKNLEFREDVVIEIKESLIDQETNITNKPNMIFVQLESVIDPLVYEQFEYSQDALKNWRELTAKYESGLFKIPSPTLTAKTEFSVLTSTMPTFMSNPVSYNDESIIINPIESIAFILKDLGYTATALHNYFGAFYDRHTAYSSLGFDRYIPVETMQGVEFLSDMSSKDEILIDYIDKSLKKSEGKDFIFAVTMQTHSPYDEVPTVGTKIEVTGGELDDAERDSYENYLQLLSDVDVFIKDLVDYVNALQEHTVLVIYSDHYPHYILKEITDTEQGEVTMYMVVDNSMSLEGSFPETVNSHELVTHVLDIYGITGSVMNQYQRQNMNNEMYLENYSILQYDMFYGDQLIYDGQLPYEKTNLTIGIDPYKIDSVNIVDDKLVITGDGFNEYSKVYLDDKPVSSTTIDQNTIEVLRVIEFNTAVVKQISMEEHTLVATNTYTK